MVDDFNDDWAALRRLRAPDAVSEARTAPVTAEPLEPRPKARQEPYRPRPREVLARELRALQVGELHRMIHTHVVKRAGLGEKLEEMHLDDIDSIPPV